jgi:hypothetical protein
LKKIGSSAEYRACSEDFWVLFDFFCQKEEKFEASFRKELTDLYYEAREILSGFIGEKDLKPLENDFWKLYNSLYEDQETRSYFYQLRNWANDMMNHPEKVADEEQERKASEFIDRGIELMKGKYGELLHTINGEFKDVVQRIQNDKYAKALGYEMSQFRQAISGASPFGMFSQIRHLVMPVMKQLISELPLPTIEGQTETSRYLFENMTLKGKELNLDDVCVSIKFGLKDLMKFRMVLKNIHATVQGVHFKYDNFGTIEWHDEGTFNCSLTIPQWTIKWIVEERREQPPQFSLKRADGQLSEFSIDIEEAKHQFIDKVGVTLFSGIIRKRIEAELERTFQEKAQFLTDKLNGMWTHQQTPWQGVYQEFLGL